MEQWLTRQKCPAVTQPMEMQVKKTKICFVSSIPVTLWSFYRCLIEDLMKKGWEVEICSSAGQKLDEFQARYSVKTHAISIPRQITPWQDIKTVWALRRLFRARRYDIVHAHTPKAGLLAMIAAALAGIKVRLYTCHGLAFETESGWKKQLLIASEKLSFGLAHQVLVVSRSVYEKLKCNHIGRPDKMHILGDGTACGIDIGRFTPDPAKQEQARMIKEKLGIQSQHKVVGFVGRLVPDKGVHVLVESFLELYQHDPDVRLLIVGELEPHRGSLSENILSVIQSHPGIVRVGFTDQIEIYYLLMNILVLPTRREGFPYTLIEAGAMEIPVIATRVTGCIDAVIDHQTGILIPPESPSDLTRAIQTLLYDKSLAQSMGRQARDRVVKQFSSERLTKLHLNLYQEILSQAHTN
jgi:glycosyltransferase involved in cell wall biosynthesis